MSSSRCVIVVALCFMAVVINSISQPSLGQEGKAKSKKVARTESKSSNRDQRLDEIEKRLMELINDVKSLRTSEEPPKSAPAATTTTATAAPALDARWFDAISWRAIGPANMGGRIVDLAIYEKDPSLFWV